MLPEKCLEDVTIIIQTVRPEIGPHQAASGFELLLDEW